MFKGLGFGVSREGDLQTGQHSGVVDLMTRTGFDGYIAD